MTRARAVLLALVAVWSADVRAHALADAGGLLRVSVAPSLSSAANFTVAVTDRAAGGERRLAPLAPGTNAVFTDLPPARYDVELIAAGAVLASLAAPLGPGENVILEVQADGAAGFRLAIVDRHQRTMASAFDQRMLADLPASRDVWTLIETSAPYVIADQLDNGGARLGRSPAMGSRSSSWTVTTVSLGDVVVQDPGSTARLDLEPEPAFLSGVLVSAGLAPVEVGTPGVRVSMTPRRPGPQRAMELFGSATTAALVGTNALPGAPSGTRLTGWREGGGVAGGPVTDDIGLLVAGSASGSQFTERGRPERLDASRVTVFGHLVARRSLREQWRVIAGVQRLGYPFDDRRQFANRAAVTEAASLMQAQVTWERQLETGGALSASIGLSTADRTPSPGGPAAGGVVDRLIDGPVPSPAADVNRRSWNLRARWDGRERAWASASHALRGGFSLQSTSRSSTIVAAPVVAETVAGLPARVWLARLPDGSSHRRATDVALWVADNLAWSPRLTMDIGLRLDRTTGRARGASEGLSWTTLSPRVSVRWVLEPFAVFAGAGRYAASHALSLLAHGDPGESWSAVHRWDDPDGNGRFSADELGPLVARAGWGAAVASIAPDVRAPVTREIIAGAEYQVGHSTLHGAILVRRETRLVRSVNVGVPASAWDVRLVADANADWDHAADDQLLSVYDRRPSSFGLDAFELVNVGDERVTYGGIEVGWSFLSDRWSMLFGARAYRTRALGASRGFGPLENDQHVLGELHHQPNAMPGVPGSLFFDRSYVGKWAGSFHATDTWRFAFAARYQDGQAFSRVVVVPDLAIGPDLVQAYRLGQTRYTYTFTLDARVEKALRLAGRPVAVRLDVFNLTNHQNELDEDVLTSPAFRTPLSVQPPITVRLGFRVMF